MSEVQSEIAVVVETSPAPLATDRLATETVTTATVATETGGSDEFQPQDDWEVPDVAAVKSRPRRPLRVGMQNGLRAGLAR